MNIVKEKTFIRDISKSNDKTLTELVNKTIDLFLDNKEHPSLHNKHITCKKADNLFSIRVTQKYRILYFDYKDKVVFSRFLDHDKYDRLTKSC
jgi:plasmid maintenance system killer protein